MCTPVGGDGPASIRNETPTVFCMDRWSEVLGVRPNAKYCESVVIASHSPIF